MSDSYQALADFISYIKRLEGSGFDMAAAIYVYIGIDMLCLVHSGKNKQGRSDFIAWVDSFMDAGPHQPYQYRGKDVYAARCAALHEYGSESDAHSDEDIKKFAYTDGGKHMINSSVDDRLVIIGIKSFVYDFFVAVEKFIEAAIADSDLGNRLDSRFSKFLKHVPI